MVVLELGCGTSIHSLRIEADALLQRRKHTTLVRVNPKDHRSDVAVTDVSASSQFIGVGLSARAALMAICERVEKQEAAFAGVVLA